MIDHLFCNSYIDDIISIGREKENIFLFRGKCTESVFIKNPENFYWFENDFDSIGLYLKKKCRDGDSLFVHWFDMQIGRIVVAVPDEIKIFAYLWGGDFFEDPYYYHRRKIYQPATLAMICRFEKDAHKSLLKNRSIFLRPLTDFFHFRQIQRQKSLIKHKAKQIQRLNGIILHPASSGDTRAARLIYKYPTLYSIPGFYDLNFDLATTVVSPTFTKKTTTNILVNNAAHYSGNHLDAFDKLKPLPESNMFYCPLSYGGNNTQINIIKEQGYENFGKRFMPITNFLSKEEYVNFLNTMDVLFMYQNISQGFGNIVTAISLGKPIFLRNCNTLTELFLNLGITVYDADLISEQLIVESIEESKNNYLRNVAILKDAFSTETRLNYLKEIIS